MSIAIETERDTRAPGQLIAIVERWRLWLLGAIVAIAAAAQVQELSSGPFYRDDAWVALANRVPLGTAIRMASTTPLFTLFERFWTGLAPGTTWFAQLPNLLAGLASIIALYALIKWNGFSTWVALASAFGLAIARESTVYGTHLKPYSFSILTTIILLWLAERVRRSFQTRDVVALCVASILICAFSFTSLIVVVAAFAVVTAQSVIAQRSTVQTLIAAAIAGVAILGEYWLLHNQITPALRASWSDFYLQLGSPLRAWTSTHRAAGGLFRGLSLSPSISSLWILGYVGEVLTALLFVLGLCVGLRRQVLSVSVIALAVALSIVHRVPIGTDRTDTYLYPCFFLVIASGLKWVDRTSLSRKRLRAILSMGAIGLIGIFGVVRVIDVHPYPGGDLSSALKEVEKASRQPGTMVLIEGTARWPWAYYVEPRIHLIFGPDFNTGFTAVSDVSSVVISPHTNVEPHFNPAAIVEDLRAAKRVVTLNYGDITGLTDPLQPALTNHCWLPVSHHTYGTYIVNQLVRNPDPNCRPQ